MENKLRTCNSCGWVHFGMSMSDAQKAVDKFNEYFNTLPVSIQIDHYGGKGATLHQYTHCFFCNGSYENFRDAVAGDCPDGCTIQAIVNKDLT